MKKPLLSKKYGYALTSALFFLTAFFPLLNIGSASAATQLASRNITMSDSGASGGTITSGVGSGTQVSYRVSFGLSDTSSSLVIDFCSTTPIIADTCTAPTGMNAAGATLNAAGVGDAGQVHTWTSVTASASQIKLAVGTGTAATGTTPTPTTQTFTLDHITNPSTVGSFYARIYTYTANNWTGYTNAGSPGTYIDYGGIALATTQVIKITARVQETLSFCVTGLNPSQWTAHDCSDATAASTPPSLVLGHGSPTATLDASQTDSGTVFSQISTNATTGASIAMRNSNNANSCTNGGLSADAGQTCAIPGIGATAAAIVPGTADFGLYVWNGELDTNGVGSVSGQTPYNDGAAGNTFKTTAGAALATFLAAASANTTTNVSGDIFPDSTVHYGMDATTTVTNPSPYGNVLTEFGSVVAKSTAPCYRVDNAYTFSATASLTTPAGIYTANMNLIATGTF